jgi:hypothetical protein
LEGVQYDRLAAYAQLEPERVRVMIRSAERRFVAALERALARDGIEETELEGEIRKLLEASA